MNILEEYLVKIGAEVDTNSFNGATRAINELSNMLSKLSTALKVGGMLAAMAKLFDAVVSNIKAVAELDMQYQKLANSMWVTKDTAKQLKTAMDVMGASQEDIAWIPELREQFFRLREEMAALSTPQDADNQLLWIRQIGYDVQSLQVKFKMLREWIVYYLIKYLKPYIEEFQKFIQWINKQIGDNMPKIAKKAAKVLGQLMSVIIHAGRALKDIGVSVWRFFRELPAKVRALVPIMAVAGLMIMRSPFGLMLTAIGGALLLLQDFYYFLDGKRSSKALAPMWEWLTNDNNPLRKAIGAISEMLSNVITRLVDFFSKVFTAEVRKDLVETAEKVAEAVGNIAKGIADIISYFTKGDSKASKFWDSFADGAERAIWRTLKVAKAIGKLFNAMGLALQGKFKEAGKELLSAGSDVMDAAKDQFGTPGVFYNFFDSVFGNNSSAGDRAQALVDAQPTALLGDRNGCTRFVRTALGGDDTFMKEMNGNLWVPEWLKKAKETGRFNSGTAGMQRGDIIVVDYGSGTGDHVIMYDGNGGYYGNSSNSMSKIGKYGKPVHGNLSDFEGNILGHIKTGAPGLNPNSYAAKTPMGVPAPSLVNGLGAPTNYNTNSQTFGNIVINVNGAGDPKATGYAIKNIIDNPTPYLNANRCIAGGAPT